MPSTQEKNEIKTVQLIPPKPVPIRSKPFQLSGNAEWLIYPHGKTVYLYNLKDQSLNLEYREHAYPVGVAKLSPSGQFIASGDQCGNLRIFNLNDLNTRIEAKVLGGMINDLNWSEDEKYIAVSGEGRDQFANVVKVDLVGGEVTAFGELTGPSKSCPTITLRSSLLLLGSDDKSLTIYRAAPKFKFIKTLRDHEGFVQVARFSPDGSKFVTAGADGRVFIYSTESFEILLNGYKLHEAGILALEWIDNDTILTGSADKSLKLWKSVDGAILKTSEIKSDWNFEQQICGILILNPSTIITLRLNGSFECRDINTLEILTDNLFKGIGHSKSVVDLSSSINCSLRSASYDGNVKNWKFNENNLLNFEKEINCKNVQKLSENGIIFENKIITGENIKEFTSKIVACNPKTEVVALSEGTFNFKADLAAFNENGDILAVTNSNGQELKLYKCDSGYEQLQTFDNLSSKITAISFSSKDNSFATADEQRRIKIYSFNEEKRIWTRQSSQWCNHSARIDTLLWTEDGSMVLSAGVDGHIMVWSLETNKIGPICTLKAAHSSPINKLQVIKSDGIKRFLFASSANDSCIKLHELIR